MTATEKLFNDRADQMKTALSQFEELWAEWLSTNEIEPDSDLADVLKAAMWQSWIEMTVQNQ